MSQAFNISPDDVIGALIHNCNQAASHLTTHGGRSDFAALADHLLNMQHKVAHLHALQQQATASAPPAGASSTAEARAN